MEHETWNMKHRTTKDETAKYENFTKLQNNNLTNQILFSSKTI
jgi:hypothetical protein